jgi:hypothetical protein
MTKNIAFPPWPPRSCWPPCPPRIRHIAPGHRHHQADFQPRGQATLDRLAEDGVQAICNRTGNKPPEDIAKRLEADQWPASSIPPTAS